MRHFTLLIAIIFSFSYTLKAQTSDCNCSTDLNYLNTKLRKTPSFKDLSKTEKKSYHDFYLALSEETPNAKSDYDCFLMLCKLTLPLKDNHIKVYANESNFNEKKLQIDSVYEEFKNSYYYTLFPSYSTRINIDSLETELSSQPFKSVEGIYYANKDLKIVVFNDLSNEKSKIYKAIVLESTTKIWKKGELIYSMIPYGEDYFLLVGGTENSKRLISYTERIDKGMFLGLGYKKDTTQKDFSYVSYPDSIYLRKELSDQTTYIKVGSFEGYYPILSDAEKFYATLENSLTKSNLIIDLRNNGGGGNRNSDILFKIIKDYIKNNEVHLIVNHATGSNAEQFVHRLSSYPNCKVFGDRTNGTAAYEVKNSIINLPCQKYIAVLTSKRHKEYLYIETKGIEPNIKLDYQKDWLMQVMEYIQKQK